MKKNKIRAIAMLVLATTLTSNIGVHRVYANNETKPILAGQAEEETFTSIGGIKNFSAEEHKVTLETTTGEFIRVSFLDNDVVRIYMDPTGDFQEKPTPNSPNHVTEIIYKQESEYPRVAPTVTDGDTITLATDTVELRIDKATSKMELVNKTNNSTLWKESAPLKYNNGKTIQTLETNENEYFYGGGHQNGRFSHKGETIKIVNDNNWVDGGVASPNPFYFSTSGYGVMRHTFKPGQYAFGSEVENTVTTTHNEQRFDAYYFVDDTPTKIIDKFTELTGDPAFLPEYAYYLGHLDCFSRDWINDQTGAESQNPAPGHDRQETLMVDAKKVLDDHISNDMPLGYIMPNDGYGCGYGREATIDENIDLLREFTEYANSKGIQTGLWTQSDLKPSGNGPEYLQRDIDKEVGVGGTNAVKTDVAWVGPGYSFALDSVRKAYEGINNNSKVSARPYVVSLDGWAGTQRYAGIWSGDQTGGDWEYIRFHIPSYIGAGLSGQPNVGSDIDGIFGGNQLIQTRDFQWKAFTPIQLDMDGWGSNEKTPYVFGEPYASINRMYLKMKAEMMPYVYTLAEEASTDSTPMIRPMMFEESNTYTNGTDTEYQYMWGPNMLVAPVYQDTASDENGNDIRNDIYLPDSDQIWIDYFTGDQYRGGGVLNNFEAPMWKLPLFIKNGAIIPLNNENNTPEDIDHSQRIFEVYPSGNTEFEVYEDDGISTANKNGQSARTLITSKAPKTGKGTAIITANTLNGNYTGMETQRSTEFIVNVSEKPSNLSVAVGGTNVELTEATTLAEYEAGTNMFFYDETPNLNKYATEGYDFANVNITTTPKMKVKVDKTDVTTNIVELTVNDFINTQDIGQDIPNANLTVPTNLASPTITPETINLTWDAVEGATSYDVEIDGTIFKNITATEYSHLGLKYDTDYSYRVRSVNNDGYSEWSELITVRTDLDPFRNVPKDMQVIWNHGQYSNETPDKAVDGDENSQFHSAGGDMGKPFVVDMQKAYDLEKLEFLFRNYGNGSVKRAEIYTSIDGQTYDKVFDNTADTGNPAWATDGQVKTINFNTPQKARYIKLVVEEAVGNFIAIREIRPYKVDGTEGKVVGDWNNSGSIDDGDLTFLDNYNGLANVDSDWDYVKSADLNKNGLIDSYDVAYVASKLDGGVVKTETPLAGSIMLVPSKTDLKANETFTVDIVGTGLADVNAFSVELPIDSSKFEVVQAPVATKATESMRNISKNRVHSDNTQDVYATFTNVGEAPKLSGTNVLSQVTLKAKVDTTFAVLPTHSMLVDSRMEAKNATANVVDVNSPLPEAGTGAVQIPSSSITVTGDESQLQTNMGLDKLIDGTTDSADGSRMDLKWVFTPDQADKGTLPFEMTFNFDQPKSFDSFSIYNRMNGNTVHTASAKKVKAVGYLNGVATELGEQSDIDTPLTTFDLNNQKFDKIVITALESGQDIHTLSINEIKFFENGMVEPTGIQFSEGTPDLIEKNVIVPVTADVLPGEATNTYYRITSDNPEVVDVMRVDDGDNVNFYLVGKKGGSANITATSANGEFTVSKSVTVEGAVEVDKAELAALIETAEEHAANKDHYTTDSFANFETALTSANSVYNDANATQEAVNEATTNLNTAIENLVLVEIKVGKVTKFTGSASDTSVSLTWEKPKSEVGLVEYVIYKDGKEAMTLPADTLEYNFTGLKANNIYNFKIVSVYANGEKSRPVSINVRTLKEVVNKTVLEEAIQTAKNLDEAKYSERSYKSVQKELANAIKVKDNQKASEKKVTSATKDLKSAIDKLQLK